MILRLLVALCYLLGIVQADARSLIGASYPGTSPSLSSDLRVSSDVRLNNTRSGTAWDFNCAGAIVAYASGSAQGCVQGNPGGVPIYNSRSNFLINSTAPATQTRTLTTGTYAFWIKDSDTGSAALTGISCRDGRTTVTAGPDCILDVSAASTSITFAPSGTVTFWQSERCVVTSGATVCARSPPIVTGATAPVARSADSIVVPNASTACNVTCSFFVKWFLPRYNTTLNHTVMAWSDGTANNQIIVYLTPSSGRLTVAGTIGGTNTFSSPISVVDLTKIHSIAVNKTPQGFAFAFDGAGTIKVPLPNNLNLTQFNLGANGGGTNWLNGYVQAVSTYASALSDFSMAALVASLVPYPTVAHLAIDDGQSLSVGARGFNLDGSINYATAPAPTCALTGLGDTWGIRGDQIYPSSAANIIGLTGAHEQIGPGVLSNGFGSTHMTSMGANLCAWQSQARTYILQSIGAAGKTCAELSKGAIVPSGNAPYANGMNYIARYSQLATLNADTAILDGIGYQQGEKDRSPPSGIPTSYADYTACLSTLYSNFNTDTKALTGQTANLRFGFYQLQSSARGQGSIISQAQFDFAYGAAANPQADVIVPGYIFPFDVAYPYSDGSGTINGPDGIHRSADGYDRMGAYGARWRDVTFGCPECPTPRAAQPWHSLHPLTTNGIVWGADHQHIIVNLDVPVPPVRINTSLPQNTTGLAELTPANQAAGAYYAANEGLVFQDDCGTVQIAASGVTVLSPTSLGVTLTALSTCTNPMLQAGYNGFSMPNNDLPGAWTNISDSDTTTDIKGNAMPAWLLIFNLPVKVAS